MSESLETISYLDLHSSFDNDDALKSSIREVEERLEEVIVTAVDVDESIELKVNEFECLAPQL